jgi:hypothetical protein
MIVGPQIRNQIFATNALTKFVHSWHFFIKKWPDDSRT